MDQSDSRDEPALLFPDVYPPGGFPAIARETYLRLKQALGSGENVGKFVQGHTGSDGVESVVLSQPGLRNGEIFFSVSRGYLYNDPKIFIDVHNYDSGQEHWLYADDPGVDPKVMGEIAAAFGLTPG